MYIMHWSICNLNLPEQPWAFEFLAVISQFQKADAPPQGIFFFYRLTGQDCLKTICYKYQLTLLKLQIDLSTFKLLFWVWKLQYSSVAFIYLVATCMCFCCLLKMLWLVMVKSLQKNRIYMDLSRLENWNSMYVVE